MKNFVLLLALTSTCFVAPPLFGAANLPDGLETPLRKRLLEKSPIITKIEIIRGDPFIEVFIVGWAALDCFDEHEYKVDIESEKTVIVPRFRSFKADDPCNEELQKFREKAADLDPANPASKLIEVLDYYGWKRTTVKNESP